jgi:hypothetical protein
MIAALVWEDALAFFYRAAETQLTITTLFNLLAIDDDVIVSRSDEESTGTSTY